MVIAVNTKFLFNEKGNTRSFIFDCLTTLAKQFSQHTFLFIFDKNPAEPFVFQPNIIPLVAGPESKNPLLVKVWLNYKVPSILKKNKADILITSVCSLRTDVPQLLIINKLTFLNLDPFIPKRFKTFYNKNFFKFLSTASVSVTFSDYCKRKIIEEYEASHTKINLLPYGIKEIYKPVSYDEKISIQEQYSGGNEYFLVLVSSKEIQSLLNLLKAFSIFKKWQKSNMQLLIISKDNFKTQKINESLRLFKYRNEVKLVENLEQAELARIIAGAYVLVQTGQPEIEDLAPVEAMKCDVPVITLLSDIASEFFGDAVLFINSYEPAEIAEKMMVIFKDEKLRSELIEKGRKQSNKFNNTEAPQLLWDSVLKAIN